MRRILIGMVLAFASTSALADITSILPLPGGSDTQVQYNDGGLFGGDSGMTYNETTDRLTVSSVTAAWLNVSTMNVSQLAVSQLTSNVGDTQVSFSSAGIIRGDAGLTYSYSTDTLSVSTISATTTVTSTVTANRFTETGSDIGAGQVIYSSAGNLSGDTGMTFDPDTDSLTITTMTATYVSVSSVNVTNQVNMNSKKIVRVATGTAHGDAAIYGQLKVLQVLQYTITGSTASIVNTFVPTSLTGAITPTSTSNKVLLMMTSRSANGTGAKSCTYTFMRNGANILGAQGGTIHQDTDAATIFPLSMVYLDSPGTTSSVTYTVGIMGDTGSTCTMGQTNLTSTLIVAEINGI